MDLCTVISQKFVLQALNLIQSYKIHSYNQRIYLYYFNFNSHKPLKLFKNYFGDQITLIKVPRVCAHALEPRIFFYKVYAINDCLLNHSDGIIYSDSGNCFIKKTDKLEGDLIDGALFLTYNHPKLTNQFWTTEECFKTLNAPGAEVMMQYWAGFQVYKKTDDNISFISDMYDSMMDPRVALPDTTVDYPDGPNKKCISHRQDQSALSVLIHKHNRHQFFDTEKNERYGDHGPMLHFDKGYKKMIQFNKIVLSARESKSNYFRFLKNK